MKGAQASTHLLAALQAWGLTQDALHSSICTGLINETYCLEVDQTPSILQRVHPVFAPEIHQNIRAVSEHLQNKGLCSPQLLSRPNGADVYVDEENRCWRMLEYVPGSTVETIESAEQAYATAGFLARWHGALVDIRHAFVGMRSGVHDTQAHRERLQLALHECTGHRLWKDVRDQAQTVFAMMDNFAPLPDLELAVAHGDPKIANLRFEVGGNAPRAWIDLDTVGPMKFGHELGDALRSWCNAGREDKVGSEVDLDRYRAAKDGYAEHTGGLTPDQNAGFLWGPCWISAELGMRFLADALREAYFGWDVERYPAAGEHNLARGKAQLELAKSFLKTVQARS